MAELDKRDVELRALLETIPQASSLTSRPYTGSTPELTTPEADMRAWYAALMRAKGKPTTVPPVPQAGTVAVPPVAEQALPLPSIEELYRDINAPRGGGRTGMSVRGGIGIPDYYKGVEAGLAALAGKKLTAPQLEAARDKEAFDALVAANKAARVSRDDVRMSEADVARMWLDLAAGMGSGKRLPQAIAGAAQAAQRAGDERRGQRFSDMERMRAEDLAQGLQALQFGASDRESRNRQPILNYETEKANLAHELGLINVQSSIAGGRTSRAGALASLAASREARDEALAKDQRDRVAIARYIDERDKAERAGDVARVKQLDQMAQAFRMIERPKAATPPPLKDLVEVYGGQLQDQLGYLPTKPEIEAYAAGEAELARDPKTGTIRLIKTKKE